MELFEAEELTDRELSEMLAVWSVPVRRTICGLKFSLEGNSRMLPNSRSGGLPGNRTAQSVSHFSHNWRRLLSYYWSWVLQMFE